MHTIYGDTGKWWVTLHDGNDVVIVSTGANLNYEDNRDRTGLTLTVRAFDSNPDNPMNSMVKLTLMTSYGSTVGNVRS